MNFEDFIEKDWSFLDSGHTRTAEVEKKIERIISARKIEGSSVVLVSIKKYDNVNGWQGELIYLPEKWASFDVMFLYFLPSLPFELDQVFGALATRCAILVISHPEGREVLEQQRQQYPEFIVSNLPDKLTLEIAAAGNSFEVIEFVDEAGIYLAVLQFKAKC
ncbi:hypothetical protein POM88_007513 [Heracleum sosnowskyi]|uniref:Uncharacterized protein n=1 Tax=Heracleum sosnowskyi TaxID=360622 RepID=A0AAD8N0X9_9APIA|nr:hypothetical protein POM88_007513 [Heracleum sosnowskyi]